MKSEEPRMKNEAWADDLQDGLADDELDDLEPTATGDEAQLYEHFRVVVDKGQEMVRVDKYLFDRIQNASRNRIQKAADAGFVLANGRPVKCSYRVKPLDVITLSMDRPPYENDITPEDIPLDIVYEDDDVLVVNKSAGMVVHPGHGHFEGTLVNALAHHLGISQGPDADDERMGILVHRIDKDTSGLLAVAKNDESQLKLAKQFYDHSIDRRYVAIVWGNVKDDEGTVDSNIVRDPNDRLRFMVTDDPEKGKHAVTHYRVLERFGFITFIECRLETGRTHQIRVHMSSLGYPIFNDARYGGSEIRKGTIYSKYKQFIANCFEICPRQALHAATLGFSHPKTGEWLQFESPLPEDMAALLEKWRKYCGLDSLK